MKYTGLLLFFDAPGIKNAQSTAKSTPRRTTQAVFGPAIKKIQLVVLQAKHSGEKKKRGGCRKKIKELRGENTHFCGGSCLRKVCDQIFVDRLATCYPCRRYKQSYVMWWQLSNTPVKSCHAVTSPLLTVVPVLHFLSKRTAFNATFNADACNDRVAKKICVNPGRFLPKTVMNDGIALFLGGGKK